MTTSDPVKKAIIEQGTAAAVGATIGAVTKKAYSPSTQIRSGRTAAEVASATAAAAAGGAGISGSVAAGAAVVTAKVAAATAVATAAAPLVVGIAVVGAVGYGISRLFKQS